MTEPQTNDFELFCKNQILQGIPTEELKSLFAITHRSTFEQGSTLLHEGQTGDQLYFILEGTLEATRSDPENGGIYTLGELSAGEVVGEIAFVDKGARSASVKAITKTTIRSLSFSDLERLMNESTVYSRIYAHMSKHISERLRELSNRTLEAVINEEIKIKTRGKMGVFLVYIITLLSLFAYSLKWLKFLIINAPNTSYVSIPFTLIVGISLLLILKHSKIELKEFGIKLTNWKQALYDGILLSIPFMILGIPVKYAMLKFHPAYENASLFDPFSIIRDPEYKTLQNWLFINLVYWILVVPLQELLARGVMQGLLENFLDGKRKVLSAIIISNLIFGTVHIHYSVEIAVVVLILGLYLGWIYSRTHNLISSSIAHAILGTWGLSVLGAVV